MTPAEWRKARKAARKRHRDAEPDTLAPPELFSDREASETCARAPFRDDEAKTSPTVRAQLAHGCAGWKRQPSAEGFTAALRADDLVRKVINTTLPTGVTPQVRDSWARARERGNVVSVSVLSTAVAIQAPVSSCVAHGGAVR